MLTTVSCIRPLVHHQLTETLHPKHKLCAATTKLNLWLQVQFYCQLTPAYYQLTTSVQTVACLATAECRRTGTVDLPVWPQTMRSLLDCRTLTDNLQWPVWLVSHEAALASGLWHPSLAVQLFQTSVVVHAMPELFIKTPLRRGRPTSVTYQ